MFNFGNSLSSVMIYFRFLLVNTYLGVLEDDMKQVLLTNVTLLSHILSGGSLEDRSALAYFVCTALLHKCIDSCPDTRVNGLEQNLKNIQ